MEFLLFNLKSFSRPVFSLYFPLYPYLKPIFNTKMSIKCTLNIRIVFQSYFVFLFFCLMNFCKSIFLPTKIAPNTMCSINKPTTKYIASRAFYTCVVEWKKNPFTAVCILHYVNIKRTNGYRSAHSTQWMLVAFDFGNLANLALLTEEEEEQEKKMHTHSHKIAKGYERRILILFYF